MIGRLGGGNRRPAARGTPARAEQLIERLATAIAGYGLDEGIAQSLLAKVGAARASLDRPPACNILSALTHEIEALAGSRLTPAQAEDLTRQVATLMAKLSC